MSVQDDIFDLKVFIEQYDPDGKYGVTVDMPDFLTIGGEGGQLPNSLDVFTQLGALEQLQARITEARTAQQEAAASR